MASIDVIYKISGEETEVVHVSYRHEFDTCWMPIVQHLGLEWIPIFSTGIVLEKADIPFIIAELKSLQQVVMEKTKIIQLPLCSELGLQILKLVTILKDLIDRDIEDLWIG